MEIDYSSDLSRLLSTHSSCELNLASQLFTEVLLFSQCCKFRSSEHGAILSSKYREQTRQSDFVLSTRSISGAVNTDQNTEKIHLLQVSRRELTGR